LIAYPHYNETRSNLLFKPYGLQMCFNELRRIGLIAVILPVLFCFSSTDLVLDTIAAWLPTLLIHLNNFIAKFHFGSLSLGMLFMHHGDDLLLPMQVLECF